MNIKTSSPCVFILYPVCANYVNHSVAILRLKPQLVDFWAIQNSNSKNSLSGSGSLRAVTQISEFIVCHVRNDIMITIDKRCCFKAMAEWSFGLIQFAGVWNFSPACGIWLTLQRNAGIPDRTCYRQNRYEIWRKIPSLVTGLNWTI